MQKRQSAEGIRTDNNTRKRQVERARKAIYVKGKPIGSKHVDKVLGDVSLVPTRVCPIPFIFQQRYLELQNAFSTKLGPHGFDFYTLFVPDLLHKFDLGVWKAVFTHLMRVLYAAGGDAIQALNER